MREYEASSHNLVISKGHRVRGLAIGVLAAQPGEVHARKRVTAFGVERTKFTVMSQIIVQTMSCAARTEGLSTSWWMPKGYIVYLLEITISARIKSNSKI